MFRSTLFLSVFFFVFPIERAYACAADQVVDQTTIPHEIRSTLQSHMQEIQRLMQEFSKDPGAVDGINVRQFSWLPEYYFKYGVSRHLNAQDLTEKLELHGLSGDVGVTSTFLFHIAGKPLTLADDHYVVLEKKVIGINPSTIRNQCPRMQAILHSVEEVGKRYLHLDMQKRNYLITYTDHNRAKSSLAPVKAIIVDTDHWAMPREPERSRTIEHWERQPTLSPLELDFWGRFERFRVVDKIFKRQKEALASLQTPSAQDRQIALLRALEPHQEEIFALQDSLRQKRQEIHKQQKSQESLRAQHREELRRVTDQMSTLLSVSQQEQEKLQESLKAQHREELRRVTDEMMTRRQQEQQQLRKTMGKAVVGAFVVGGVFGASLLALVKYKPATQQQADSFFKPAV